MRKAQAPALDFRIDRPTNSVQNTISGDSFATEVLRLPSADLKNINKKAGWKFNWKEELGDNTRDVYKLTIVGNPNIVQGLISLSMEPDHVYMHLVESAPFNFGKDKLYEGVPGNLVAFACKLSFQHNFDGFVAFTAKSKLIAHYQETLGAQILSGQRMILPTSAAQNLVDKYFKTL